MDHLERVEIAPERLARWREAANRLGDAGIGLGLELADIARDPTRHMLGRAARAARHAEKILTGDLQLIANAVATEIENDASSRHVG